MDEYRTLIKEQDQYLDEILKIVVRQKEIAKTINKEVSSQNILLNELKLETELTKTKLNSSNKILNKMVGKSWLDWFKSWFK